MKLPDEKQNVTEQQVRFWIFLCDADEPLIFNYLHLDPDEFIQRFDIKFE